MTSLSSPPRSGSGQTNTGRSTQSDALPGAWLVLEPSKPQMPGSSPSAMILVLLRISGVGSQPSIQMYSARYTNEGSLIGAARRPPDVRRTCRSRGLAAPGGSCSQRSEFQQAVSDLLPDL